MSTVGLAIGAMAALAYISMRDDDEKPDPSTQADTKKPADSLNTRFTSGAVYTDVRDTREILDHPGMIISEEKGTDLSGVDCRWLKMQNGVIIRTYDMQTQFIR